MAPNHIKSLLLSTQRPEVVRNSIVKNKVQLGVDPFKDTNGFPFILMNHKIINKIEVFRGFHFGYNVQHPIFNEMTKDDLFGGSLPLNTFMLCRQRRYYNPTYGVEPTYNINIPLLDEYFFLFKESTDSAQSISNPVANPLFDPTTEPLLSVAEQRIRFLDSSDPSELIRPEYVEAGLLETPRLDDGLSDPIRFDRVAASARSRAMGSSVGENEQRLKNMGLGYLLRGYTNTGEPSNATARKNGSIQTKSIIMKTKQEDESTPQDKVSINMDFAKKQQDVKKATGAAQSSAPKPSGVGTPGSGGSGGSTY